MEYIGYFIFAVGWPVLIVGSIWLWRHEAGLSHDEKIFLNVCLTAFYLLGYVATAYWQGWAWYVGVIPAFVLFLALFAVTLRTVHQSIHREAGHGTEAHV